jgi:hypothetical protein
MQQEIVGNYSAIRAITGSKPEVIYGGLLMKGGDDMRLGVIDTGSKANSYILGNDEEVLLIEAGRSFMDVKETLDFNIRPICGLICSHSHG